MKNKKGLFKLMFGFMATDMLTKVGLLVVFFTGMLLGGWAYSKGIDNVEIERNACKEQLGAWGHEYIQP